MVMNQPPETGKSPIAKPGDGRSLGAALGDIVQVLTLTEGLNAFALKDLEWLVMPGLQTGQFAIAHGDPRSRADIETAGGQQVTIPVAIVLWALVAPEVDARLQSLQDADPVAEVVRLAPDEWRSGQIPWILVAAGTPDALRATLTRLASVVFKGEPARMLVNADGKLKVELLRRPPPVANDAERA